MTNKAVSIRQQAGRTAGNLQHFKGKNFLFGN